MTARRLAFCVSASVVVAASACGNPFAGKATVPVTEDTLALFAISDAPASGPTALNIFGPIAVRTDPTQDYDVVFDIGTDAAGQPSAFALPPFAVGAFGQAGFIKDTTQAFDAIVKAPTSGYNDSTIVALRPGDVLLVQANKGNRDCVSQAQIDPGQAFIYAKIVVDSVNFTPFDPLTNPTGSTIYIRVRADPNCGFTSFADGIPRS